MHPLTVFLIAALVIFILVTLLWMLSLSLKNAGIMDVFWGPGFVLLAWLYAALSPEKFGARSLLLAGLVSLWGLRLGAHIYWRGRGRGEDSRYAAWRAEAGARWVWLSYLKVFLLQAAVMLLVSLPLLAAQRISSPLGWLDLGGTLLWALGFFFEVVGDAQLAHFRSLPANRGRVFTGGLWRFTRHPNYFGDAAQWWGVYLLAASGGGWWSLFSPAVMTWLLVRVSGVAMMDGMMATRPGYAAYAASTSSFLPWFPRSTKER